ncbi:hypothetical protein ABB37_02623 [Leptomonas pyrrhocoris]|uniref:FYVE-type domain-containing protein n=1 Tax=Leptomonas pyrrhocoris TaxID=157538 RepID=A0A0M9G5I5_LEPPY|nr:hypothetical protein ABB37_02623 [Leptomonas pyrrhocoris]XP_015661290.1 hypothetical protein ABB37_02623 [Leptomonas pyrrhocoris]KPA82850.1 hypothetical protein ABB37_02623 [Leptomonas pyrrhocoris]KPA82851.1 hypothetical protein ABB37_02623 [Leptomonas pyrrhocoris]|eukprot:XP_015661289.1 hypothetical protein ABB37_02623 [Leptomonas pyrrhocoris]
MGHSGGNNTNGATSASPPVSHWSSSDGSALQSAAPPVAPLFAIPEVLLNSNNTNHGTMTPHHSVDRCTKHHDATGDRVISCSERNGVECDDTTLVMTADVAETAVDSPGELFYVQLDPDSQLVTGVLPAMEQLHVQLTQLRRVLRQSGAVLHSLRERARSTGDDVCELYAAPSFASQTRRRSSEGSRPATSPMSYLTSTRTSARAPLIAAAERSRLSPWFAPHRRSDSVLSCSPVIVSAVYSRRRGDGDNDEDSEWCDAATIHTSSSTTAQSTPSLHPMLMPPPQLQLLEEDELNDDGRGSRRSDVTGVRRTYVARCRPDSVPSSLHTTPNMQPANGSYARSDGGGVLCLPPSTLSLAARSERKQQQQQKQKPQHSARNRMPSPTVASPSGSVMSRFENSPLLPLTDNSTRLFDHRDAAPSDAGGSGRLSEAEKTELARLSQHVAELYRRRGLLLQKADRILCQHAQQHERWEGNEERRGCYRCRRLFSRLTRRHHCRRCGRLCCAECSRYVGKKQDTSYVAPVSSARGPSAAMAHRVIIKSEYTARMTADDPHVLAEESFDEHTYPPRGVSVSALSPAVAAAAPQPNVAEEENATAAPNEDEQQLHDAPFADSATSTDSRVGRSRQHKWVRLCAPCYQNCLRARRNNVLQYLKNANLCILDDGYYYYHVMTKDELCQLSTALSKPDSFKKQVELMSHVVMERSVDYVAAAPAYSAQTLATAMQHTPDVLRTLGGISAYAFRSARQTANDYVGGYFTASRTILPDNPVGAATAALLSQADVYGSERRNTGDEECSEASVESLDDTCSETQSPSSPGTGTEQADEEDEAKATAFYGEIKGDEEAAAQGENCA